MQYSPSFCPLFSLFALLIDDLTETFATGTNFSYADNFVAWSFFTDTLKVMERLKEAFIPPYTRSQTLGIYQ